MHVVGTETPRSMLNGVNVGRGSKHMIEFDEYFVRVPISPLEITEKFIEF